MNIKELAQKYERAKRRVNRHTRSSLQITQTSDITEIIADGCSRIVHCDGNIVTFEQLYNRVTISGSRLKLRNWGTDGVTVTGIVQSIEFSETGGVRR
jgi:hypothetical protein